MQISIIVPVYNADKFVGQTIESLVNQTLDNDEYEIIIINDGSTDGSQDIIDAYQAKYPNIVAIHQENKGLIATLNYGINLAKADYIARMDADDMCYPERLAIQYDYMQQHQLDLCGSFVELIDAQGKLIKKLSAPVDHVQCKDSLIDKGVCVIYHPTVMFKKNIVTQIGGYHHNFKSAEDYDLWLKIIEANGKIGNIPQYLVQYRQHESNVTFLSRNEGAVNAVVARYAYYLREQGMDDGQNQEINIDYLQKNLPDKLQKDFELDYFEACHHHISAGDMAMIVEAIKQFLPLKLFADKALKARFYLKIANGFFINKAYSRFMLYFTLALINDIKQSAIFIKEYLQAQRINRK